jgi:hypothetical protein
LVSLPEADWLRLFRATDGKARESGQRIIDVYQQHKCQMAALCGSKDNRLINNVKLNDWICECALWNLQAGYKMRIAQRGRASFLTLLVSAIH